VTLFLALWVAAGWTQVLRGASGDSLRNDAMWIVTAADIPEHSGAGGLEVVLKDAVGVVETGVRFGDRRGGAVWVAASRAQREDFGVAVESIREPEGDLSVTSANAVNNHAAMHRELFQNSFSIVDTVHSRGGGGCGILNTDPARAVQYRVKKARGVEGLEGSSPAASGSRHDALLPATFSVVEGGGLVIIHALALVVKLVCDSGLKHGLVGSITSSQRDSCSIVVQKRLAVNFRGVSLVSASLPIGEPKKNGRGHGKGNDSHQVGLLKRKG